MLLRHDDAPPGGTAFDDIDVCVVGAGPAGITVARRVAAAGRRVLLLEAGGFDVSVRSQDVYLGRSVGDPYLPLDTCRLRYFGGTSNHWGGWCRELDADDFVARPGVPLSGWPITKGDLVPYRDEAGSILEIAAQRPARPLSDSDDGVDIVDWQFSPPVRFNDKYRRALIAAPGIGLVVEANVVDIRLAPDSGRVGGLLVRGYGDGPPRLVTARAYVLACGGIENARLLLNADSQVAGGIGNGRGWVGRCFADHLHFEAGSYVDFRGVFGARSHFVAPRASAGTAALKCAFLVERYADGPWEEALGERLRSAFCRAAPALAPRILGTFGARCEVGRFRAMAEQAPNPESRVRLAPERDRFGRRRIALDWRKQPIDRRGLREAALVFGRAMAAGDIGRVRIDDWLLDDARDWPVDDRLGGAHHMGTTRMAADPSRGVVDADCRVFGTANLYIAGSSVFPTYGYANPTLTVVQLALRLGAHLAAA